MYIAKIRIKVIGFKTIFFKILYNPIKGSKRKLDEVKNMLCKKAHDGLINGLSVELYEEDQIVAFKKATVEIVEFKKIQIDVAYNEEKLFTNN